MKTVNTVLKILSAIAFLAGTVYLIATYGDKIVEWAKNIMAKCPCCCDKSAEEDTPDEEAPSEEIPAEEAAPAEEATEDTPAETTEEVSTEEPAPVADEEDFEA